MTAAERAYLRTAVDAARRLSLKGTRHSHCGWCGAMLTSTGRSEIETKKFCGDTHRKMFNSKYGAVL